MSLPPPSSSTTALVTGASSGIGVEIARQLARRGRGVTLAARRTEPMEDLAAELADEHRVRVEVVAVDLAEPDARRELVTEVEGRGLTIDVLVNNAGLSTMGPVHSGDVEAELRMVRVDVEAVVDLCTRLLPGMVERGRGAVLNVASTAAFQPLPGQAGYGGSKAFVLHYTQALSAELKGTGVTATALCPGPVETGFAHSMGLDDAVAEKALPSIMWESAEAVAAAAVGGMEKGRGVVIPGSVNAMAAYVSRVTPKTLLLPLMARVHPALKEQP